MIIGLLICSAISFAAGAFTAGMRGWLSPIVHVTIENDSGEDLANMLLRHKSDGRVTTVMFPALKNGRSVDLKYYAGNVGGYEVEVRLADGRVLRGGSGYIEGGHSSREVITRSGIVGKQGFHY